MSHTAPRTRDARGRFVARVALTAQQPAQQPQACAAPATVTPAPRPVVVGTARAMPAAAAAMRRAYNGHGNLMTPDAWGFAVVGPWAVELSRGDGFYDRRTGAPGPELVGVTVCMLDGRRLPDAQRALCRVVADRAAAHAYLARLARLAVYRHCRAVMLAEMAACRTAGNARGVSHYRCAAVALRARYADTIEAFGLDVPGYGRPATPADVTLGDVVHGSGSRGPGGAIPSAEVSAARARIEARKAEARGMAAEYGPSSPRPAMVPQCAQQQQACAARPGGPSAPGYTGRGADYGRHGNPWADFDTADRLTLRRVRLDRGGYDDGGAYWGLGQPLFWFADEVGHSAYLRAFDRAAAVAMVRATLPLARFYGVADVRPAPAPAAAPVAMVPQVCQQQQARHLGKALGILARASAVECLLHDDLDAFYAPGECHADVRRGEVARFRQARRHARAVAGGDARKLAARAIGDKAAWRATDRATAAIIARHYTPAPRMVPQVAQQPQARDTRCPVVIGPSVYEAGARLVSRVRAAISAGRQAWAAPVVAEVHPADALGDLDFEREDAAWQAWRAAGVFVPDMATLPPELAGLVPAELGGGAGLVYAYRVGAGECAGVVCATVIGLPPTGGYEVDGMVHDTRELAELHAWAMWGEDIMADAPRYGVPVAAGRAVVRR